MCSISCKLLRNNGFTPQLSHPKPNPGRMGAIDGPVEQNVPPDW